MKHKPNQDTVPEFMVFSEWHFKLLKSVQFVLQDWNKANTGMSAQPQIASKT